MRIRGDGGVTIAELLIVMTVLGILAGVLFVPFNDLYNSNTQGLKSIIQTADTRAALRTIERDITLSSKFQSTNDITDVSGTTWQWTGNPGNDPNNRVLITQAYGTTEIEGQDVNGARNIVKSTSDCSTPLTISYVYFVSNQKLYKRTLKNTGSTTGCNGTIAQKRTCAASNSVGGCEAADALIVDNVSKFTIDYYVQSSDPSPIAAQYDDGSTLASAKSIAITLTTTTGVGNNLANVTSKMRITRINGTSL